jgi:hypothetical protein
MDNISGFGLTVNILASNTFPVGLLINQFADDADPFDIPSIQIADKAMGLNGDLIIWSKPNPIVVTLSVIAGSYSDDNLSVLLEANRVGRGKIGARDVITMTGIYPSGIPIILTNGAITDGMPGNSVASAARFKSKSYSFAFENKVGGL